MPRPLEKSHFSTELVADPDGMAIDRIVRPDPEGTGHGVTALRILRVGAGLTQHDVATAAGIRRPTVSAIETGRQAPRLTTKRRIAEALDRPLEQVFPDEKGVSRSS